MTDNNEVILKVEHLCQYFKMGHGRYLKAVDDVSFDIKKGEVFGLVGESGCGKTTTGRSIIKLYDITGGSVYFKGRRICAGTGNYKTNIAEAKKKRNEKLKKLDEEKANELNNGADPKATDDKYKQLILDVQNEFSEYVIAQKKDKAEAIHAHKYCDKDYAKERVKEVTKERTDALNACATEEEKSAIIKEYKTKLRLAKRERLVTKIQMIFQDPIASLNPRMNIRDIISEGLIINGVKDKKYIQNEVYKMLDMVGLVPEHADRYPHEFSGGQRQRIGIARSVIMKPDLIIADEPISALDVSIQAQVINLLNNLREKLGLTILFIAHDLSVVKYFSDRIGVMYFGKMVELATSDELFAHPMHPYTKSLLSAIPLPDPMFEKDRKRIVYNPLAEHDYSVDKPTMREISKGHFVYCNDEEEKKYKKQLGQAK